MTMKYTIQLHSESGSFATPEVTDVEHADSWVDVVAAFEQWADEHPRMGSDRQDARALVWKGHYKDTTDLYPDWELAYGPRGGVRRSPC